MNLLGAVATGLALGLAPDVIARALAGVSAVPGRFEQVRAGQAALRSYGRAVRSLSSGIEDLL